jgi:hypothetical protein
MTKSFITPSERAIGAQVATVFDASRDSTEAKLATFPRYVRRQQLKRFLALYEIFKLVLPVKGSIVECGVFRGFGLMSWAKLSTILEPENFIRRIYGFDSFSGFPSIEEADRNRTTEHQSGGLQADSYDELTQLIDLYDQDRFLGHMEKVRLIRGDVAETAPRFIEENPHLVVSLLFLDLDLYGGTKAAIEAFVPRMPRGAVLAFDELDNPQWPGETTALLDTLSIRNVALQRLPWDPYISYAVL